MREQRLRLIAAFTAVYVIWGSTYLAIRYAIETIPPYLMAAARFGSAGAILLVLARARGSAWPTGRQWGVALLSGALFLAGGIGGVCWVEQRVPSGLTALIVGAGPLVTVFVDWLRPGGSRPDATTSAGLVLGFGGVALLINPGATDAARVEPAGALVLIGSVLSWAIGTVYTKHVHGAPSRLMGSGASMLMGSGVLLLIAALLGETSGFAPLRVSGRSLVALAYLVAFGSVIAFTAYFWLLQHTTPAKATTYAYVNPILALLLGWAVAGEPVTSRVVLAGAVIVSAVLVVTALPHARSRLAARRPEADPAA